MSTSKHKNWWPVKAKIINRFGSIKACAAVLKCSDEAIRLSVHGRCPRVYQRLKEALA